MRLKTNQMMKLKKQRVLVLSTLNLPVSHTRYALFTFSILIFVLLYCNNRSVLGLSDLIQSRTYNPSYGNGQSSSDNSEIKQKLTRECLHCVALFGKWSFMYHKNYVFIFLALRRKLFKLEASMVSLIENASVDKTKVSKQMKEIKSSVALVKTGLTTQINILAVRNSYIWVPQDLNLFRLYY